MHRCPCGITMKVPTTTIQIYSIFGDRVVDLCDRCARQVFAIANGHLTEGFTVPTVGMLYDPNDVDDVELEIADRPLWQDA